MRVVGFIVAALILVCGSLAKADNTAGIVARHGRIYETRQAGLETQGFIEIDNSQGVADRLTGVECPVAGRTSLVGPHGDVIDHVEVPAGKKLILAANGPHILLQSTHFSVDQGGAIPCSLSFQNAGQISAYLYPVPAPK